MRGMSSRVFNSSFLGRGQASPGLLGVILFRWDIAIRDKKKREKKEKGKFITHNRRHVWDNGVRVILSVEMCRIWMGSLSRRDPAMQPAEAQRLVGDWARNCAIQEAVTTGDRSCVSRRLSSEKLWPCRRNRSGNAGPYASAQAASR